MFIGALKLNIAIAKVLKFVLLICFRPKFMTK